MTTAMTPSERITAEQISTIQDLLGAALRTSDLSSDRVQQTLEMQGEALITEILTVIHKHIERVGSIIVRKVKVDRSRAPQEVLSATGREQYISGAVVDNMPRGEGGEVEVFFFFLNRLVSDADLDREYEQRGFKPADPYSIAAVNEADPAFAEKHPNGTHWQDSYGRRCFIAFGRWGGRYGVSMGQSVEFWGDVWWFAGLRK